RHLFSTVFFLGVAVCLPLAAQDEVVPDSQFAVEAEAQALAPTKEYAEFIGEMDEIGEHFGYRCFKDYRDHRTRVAVVMEGFRVVKKQLQRLHIRTRNDHFKDALPVLDELQGLLDELVCMAASSLKPLTVKRLMKEARPLECWLCYLRRALECEDRYMYNYAIEHVSKYNRALRCWYADRQCWEMTYWQSYYCYSESEA
ncbi:MAG: hypothetical protein KDK78_03785, partial [Chlamydiia bacterium]|nr:hypothetical protein [Chlamydiia bacterium]